MALGNRTHTLLALAALLIVSGLTRSVRAEESAFGPELNPYECLGRYESATGNRSIRQINAELTKKQNPLFEPGEPRSVRAMKACVVAMLKSRVGDGDAYDYYQRAISENPEEPGYELWAGNYWTGFRGARAPVTERAEQHYYRALEKLEKLQAQGRYRDYHAVVEEWVRKRLLVLYQEDGLHILPWKAYPQHSSGLYAPGVGVSSQIAVSKDTRDFFRNNEMRIFTNEADFASSDLRAGGTATPRDGGYPPGVLSPKEKYEIPRAPLRYQLDNRVRLRHNYIGAIDLQHSYFKMEEGQITSFYWPTRYLNDVRVQEMGAGFERVLPLYPVFDFRLKGSYRYVERIGGVEFLPRALEKFNLFEAKPSFSRFIGSDKLTLDLVYVFMDLQDVRGAVENDALRERHIRAAKLEYALYSPLILPEVEVGSVRFRRHPTRGWYFYAGAMQDDEVYGVRTVTKRDIYGGTRFEGHGNYDFTLQGTYFDANNAFADVNTGQVRSEGDQSSSGFRTTLIVQRRIINPDALPGINGSFMAPDMLNLVIPVSHDVGISGRKDYANIRAGLELWFKFFGTGFLGPAVLTTIGYDYQFFYSIERAMHLVHANVRLGWGEL